MRINTVEKPIVRGVSVLAAFVVLCTAAPAPAATMTVTTREDIVADDGACSLREAVSAVNDQVASGVSAGECPAGDGIDDTIMLAKGKHSLTIPGVQEDLNAGGDLDITRSVVIEGVTGSVIDGALGSPLVFGDGDRLVHVDPAAAGGVVTTFRNLTFQGGDAWCSGIDCIAGGGAIEAINAGDMLIEDCRFSDNLTSCDGDDCGISDPSSAGAVVHGIEGDLTVRRTEFSRNASYCASTDCRAGSATVVKSDPSYSGFAATVFEDVTMSSNSVSCFATGCNADDIIDLTSFGIDLDGLVVTKNTSECAGADCTAGEVVDVDAAETTLNNLLL